MFCRSKESYKDQSRHFYKKTLLNFLPVENVTVKKTLQGLIKQREIEFRCDISIGQYQSSSDLLRYHEFIEIYFKYIFAVKSYQGSTAVRWYQGRKCCITAVKWYQGRKWCITVVKRYQCRECLITVVKLYQGRKISITVVKWYQGRKCLIRAVKRYQGRKCHITVVKRYQGRKCSITVVKSYVPSRQ